MTSTDTFNLCPPEEELCFSRGDTVVWSRIVKDEDAVIVDITGFLFTLTVDEFKDPTDATTKIFSISGSVPVGTDGEILFQFSVANWSSFTTIFPILPATAFYDLEQTDAASNLRTIRKGKFKVFQDITK